MDPAGRQEILDLARDLAHNKGMNLLFSSHLLPDVESVCDYVIVMGAGKLLASGRIEELKQVHSQSFEVRLKDDMAAFGQELTALGCSAELREDVLFVRLPDGESPQMLWRLAGEKRRQVRFLRPQRSTLEEVFLSAIERS
jgi:ABC-2 type transport system ATP-binding protein